MDGGEKEEPCHPAFQVSHITISPDAFNQQPVDVITAER